MIKVECVVFLLVVYILLDNVILFLVVFDEVFLCEKKCFVVGFDIVIIVLLFEEKV